MEFDEAYRIAEAAVKKINKRLNARVQVAILRGTWQGDTYEVIAKTATYTPRYLQQDAGPKLWKLLTEAFGTEINKNNFRTFMETGLQRHAASPELLPAASNGLQARITRRLDLRDAPDVSQFRGRDRTLQELEDRIFSGCRVLCIYGVGGVGKTALAVKLAQDLQNTFDGGVIYRSLNPPVAIDQIETDVIRYLTGEPEPEPGWENLLTQLRNHQCLVILDGWERLLCSGIHDGDYLPGCAPYGELLRRMGQAGGIQSCLIITSRETPKEIEILEAEAAHRYSSYSLPGLGETSGRTFLDSKRLVAEDESHWRELLNRYAGNPQMLNLAAARIHALGGNITSFLNQPSLNGSFAREIGELLDQHLQRLSEPENLVVHCLANHREFAEFATILQLVAQQLSNAELEEVLRSLLRRSLIQVHQFGYKLQPLFERYLVSRIAG